MDDFPFLTYATYSPEFSAQDWQAEIDRLVRRQQAISGLLSDTANEDYVLDLLAEDGIDPYEWGNAAIENIEYLISF